MSRIINLVEKAIFNLSIGKYEEYTGAYDEGVTRTIGPVVLSVTDCCVLDSRAATIAVGRLSYGVCAGEEPCYQRGFSWRRW